MKTITKEILDNLSEEAQKSPSRRKNLNYHDFLSDPLQRLLNAMEPDTYIQPHKHDTPDKRELFIILRGKALVVTFHNDGEIRQHFILDLLTENFGIEIPEKNWHSVIILKENTVLLEIKDGPYEAVLDKDFATWAPKEGEKTCLNYNQKILQQLGITL